MQDWIKEVRSYPEEKLGEYTEGLNFPASKGEIVSHARKQNLPPELVERLEKMPEKQYGDITEVVREAGKESF